MPSGTQQPRRRRARDPGCFFDTPPPHRSACHCLSPSVCPHRLIPDHRSTPRLPKWPRLIFGREFFGRVFMSVFYEPFPSSIRQRRRTAFKQSHRLATRAASSVSLAAETDRTPSPPLPRGGGGCRLTEPSLTIVPPPQRRPPMPNARRALGSMTGRLATVVMGSVRPPKSTHYPRRIGIPLLRRMVWTGAPRNPPPPL